MDSTLRLLLPILGILLGSALVVYGLVALGILVGITIAGITIALAAKGPSRDNTA